MAQNFSKEELVLLSGTIFQAQKQLSDMENYLVLLGTDKENEVSTKAEQLAKPNKKIYGYLEEYSNAD